MTPRCPRCGHAAQGTCPVCGAPIPEPRPTLPRLLKKRREAWERIARLMSQEETHEQSV